MCLCECVVVCVGVGVHVHARRCTWSSVHFFTCQHKFMTTVLSFREAQKARYVEWYTGILYSIAAVTALCMCSVWQSQSTKLHLLEC